MLIQLLLVSCVFCLFYSFRLGYPAFAYFDEVFYVPAAQALADLSGYTQNRHPPFIHLCMALSINIFGDHAFAWRLPSLIFAGLATALAGYLAQLLTNRASMFWIMVGLLSLDGLWITQARIGLPNSAMIFFILLTVICWYKGHLHLKDRRKFWFIACITAALAGTCKWQGFLVILIPLTFYLFPAHRAHLKNSTPKLLFWLAGLLTFICTYFSVFTVILFIDGMSWKDIFLLQLDIPTHHTFLIDIHRDASFWYTWPFLIRPVWYGFYNHTPSLLPQYQIVDGILCLGNPFIFIFFIPAVIFLIWRIKSNSIAFYWITLLGILIFWIPSIIIDKAGLFYHFYPVLPFMFLGIAYLFDQMIHSSEELIKIAGIFLLIIILFSFIFFYPIWTALPISYPYFLQHLWFPTWR